MPGRPRRRRAPGIDFDGGASLNGGVALDVPDPQCTGPAVASEAVVSPSCGLGPELVFLLPILARMRLRSARRRP